MKGSREGCGGFQCILGLAWGSPFRGSSADGSASGTVLGAPSAFPGKSGEKTPGRGGPTLTLETATATLPPSPLRDARHPRGASCQRLPQPPRRLPVCRLGPCLPRAQSPPRPSLLAALAPSGFTPFPARISLPPCALDPLLDPAEREASLNSSLSHCPRPHDPEGPTSGPFACSQALRLCTPLDDPTIL